MSTLLQTARHENRAEILAVFLRFHLKSASKNDIIDVSEIIQRLEP
jgi:hypothetical protein